MDSFLGENIQLPSDEHDLRIQPGDRWKIGRVLDVDVPEKGV